METCQTAPAASLQCDASISGEESLLIVQSLLCMLREKNLLSRADIEELCHRVELRATGHEDPVMPCSIGGAVSAMSAMQRLNVYLGRRYGGKHARSTLGGVA